ncbi:MAG: peptidoglycan-binding protein [Candidatus Liptonbacteria bacterium]|nr:peptidoglycan-binding protein [Candidatus Liptonbacteria bacterium]
MQKGFGMTVKGLALMACAVGLFWGSGAEAQTSKGLCVPIVGFARMGEANDPAEVRKIQEFLVQYENLEVPVSGIYDEATMEGVKVFQSRHASEVLTPWGATQPTGYVYITTRNAMNAIICGTNAPLSAEEKAVIAAYHARKNAKPVAVEASKPQPTTSAAPTPKASLPLVASVSSTPVRESAAPRAVLGTSTTEIKKETIVSQIATPQSEKKEELKLVSANGSSSEETNVPKRKSGGLMSWAGGVRDHLKWFWDSF